MNGRKKRRSGLKRGPPSADESLESISCKLDEIRMIAERIAAALEDAIEKDDPAESEPE